jgi:preprotein translocase subunit SecE
MAKTTAKTKVKAKKENAIVGYLRGTIAEVRKVHWPSRDEAWNLTKIVFLVTVSSTIFMGLLDYLFSRELQGVMQRNAIAIGFAVVVLVASVVAGIVASRRAA